MPSYIFRIAKVHDMKIPVFLREYDNNIYLKALIYKNSEDSNLVENLMPFLESEEKDNYYIITEKLNSDSIKELIDNLYSINSLSLGSTSIENGKLVIEFRFHHNYSKKVSDVLSLKIMKPLFIDKIEYQPLDNLFSLFFQEKLPLCVVRYKIPLGIYKDNSIINTIKNHKAVVEISNTCMNTELINAIVFSEDEIYEFDKIADNIYSLTLETNLLSNLREKLGNIALQRYGIFGAVNDNYLVVTVFVPSYRSLDYIKTILSNLYEYNEKNTILLDIVKPLDKNIINYI